MIGLEKGKVCLEAHSPEWEAAGKIAVNKLKKILGEKAVAVEHIGSTSIHGIKAKPIIDIMAALSETDEIKPFLPELEKAGFHYIAKEENGNYLLGCGSYYDKTGVKQTHFIHVVKAFGMDHYNYVNFRDYMNAFPYMAEKYVSLKESLEKEFANDRNSYTDGKSEFIKSVLRKATVWSFLGKKVRIQIDRPIGYVHKKEGYSLTYPVNYGYIPGILGGDGEELDVYLLGVDTPVSEYECRIIGIAHRKNDNEDKLIGCPDGMVFDQSEIAERIEFGEKYYKTNIEAVNQLSCGAVVYRDTPDGREYLLLHQKRSGRWGFPKGHKEAYETDIQTAEREIFEETGIVANVDGSCSADVHYSVTSKTSKTVRLFTSKADGKVSICSKEITGYIWANYKKTLELLPSDTIEAFVKLENYIEKSKKHLDLVKTR